MSLAQRSEVYRDSTVLEFMVTVNNNKLRKRGEIVSNREQKRVSLFGGFGPTVRLQGPNFVNHKTTQLKGV
jgi:hypothetical protein